MNEPKIDFSSLDPSRDKARWEARISALAQRAVAKRRRQLTVTEQLLVWSRPMLAVAAGVALVGWGFLALDSAGSKTTAKVEDPAMTLTAWAVNNEVPNTETVMVALGGSFVEP